MVCCWGVYLLVHIVGCKKDASWVLVEVVVCVLIFKSPMQIIGVVGCKENSRNVCFSACRRQVIGVWGGLYMVMMWNGGVLLVVNFATSSSVVCI